MSSEKKIDEATYEPICDSCEEGRYSLNSEEVWNSWNRFITEKIWNTARNSDEERIQCSGCRGRYVVQKERKSSFFCWRCKLAQCHICHKDFDIREYFAGHQDTCFPVEPNEAERKVTKLEISSKTPYIHVFCQTAEVTVPCPACNLLIMKEDGCNHLTCPCGTHCCALCKKSLGETDYLANLFAHYCNDTEGDKPCDCGRCHIQDRTIDEKIEEYAQPQPGERTQTANQDQLLPGRIRGNQRAANHADDADSDDTEFNDPGDFGYYGHHNVRYDRPSEDNVAEVIRREVPQRVPQSSRDRRQAIAVQADCYNGHRNIPRAQLRHYNPPAEHQYHPRHGLYILQTIEPLRHDTQAGRYDVRRHGSNSHGRLTRRDRERRQDDSGLREPLTVTMCCTLS